VVMPGMSGLELQQELRRRGDDIPIIVLTAYGSVHSAVDALKNGAVDFLEKPFDDNVLLEQIRRSLASVVRRHSERGQREVVRARMALLSRREREVLVHVVEGLSSKEIAVRLNVNFKTIEAHRARIMLKMEADCVAQLVRMVVDANADRDSRQP
jgi:two-component system, LuxR family, response regulator FixJ